VQVPVLFATDREPIATPDGTHVHFGARRAPSGVSFGKIVVTLPAERFEHGYAVPVGNFLVFK
jgi:hypothetical protein